MIRRPPRSTRVRSSAASDVYKRQIQPRARGTGHIPGIPGRHGSRYLRQTGCSRQFQEVPARMSQSGKTPFRDLVDTFQHGDIDRRQFLARASALGVGTTVALFLANAGPVIASGGSRNGFAFYAQDATPAAGAPGFPDTGMEGRTRGEGGELRLIQWQAPTLLNAHRSTGTKDFMASDIINEPLMRYAEDGSLLPNLITAVPSVENGLLAEDLSSATFSLLPDVLWSDGEPFTARDVQFTWEWIVTESNASVSFGIWDVIESIEVVDDVTATVTFRNPSAAWFDPFTGGNNGHIYPAHAFSDVTIKGGGDAASAARSVLQTGEYDYAWNLQVEPAVLAEMEAGGQGEIVTVPGTSVERLHINFSDPRTEVDGQFSEMNTPHPFLTDPAVREALNLAVDRELIAREFYGEGQPPTANILAGLNAFDSPNTSWSFDLEAAAKTLDDAGWVLDGDTRAKDGIELNITYATSVNQVRQKTQAVIKDDWNSIGVKVQLEQIDAGIYFDSSAGNTQNIGHMYWDINMYTNKATSSVPISYMQDWYAGPDGENIAQASNEWQGTNRQRWSNADYDAAFNQLLTATDLEQAYALLIQLNDIIINDRAVIPEVNRSADTYAISNRLVKENVGLGVGLEYNYWNIANWNTVEE